MRGKSACVAPHSLVKMRELEAFGAAVAPPVMDDLVQVSEQYLRELEQAKQSLVAMRFHLEGMPYRNNGGALVRWKIEAERLVAQGIDAE